MTTQSSTGITGSETSACSGWLCSGSRTPAIAATTELCPAAAIAILSAAMLLEHSLGMRAEAELIAQAVESVVRDGYRTRDLQGGAGTQNVGCKAMGRLVREKIESSESEGE